MVFSLRKYCISTLFALGTATFASSLMAGNTAVRFNEVMAGINGDSSMQYIELAAENSSEKSWGPLVGSNVGRTMLVFYNQNGSETGRYVLPHNPLGSTENAKSTGVESNTVLFSTQAFATANRITPDYIIPALISANSGKICFVNNPDNTVDAIDLCLSYGGSNYLGASLLGDPPNDSMLTIMDSMSLSRNVFANSFGDANHLNSHFTVATPTPASTQATPASEDNSLGEVVLTTALTAVAQGRNLFFKETFDGNGRTCETCHKENEKFGLTSATIANLKKTDSLFRNEQNVNMLVVNAMGSILPSLEEMAKPSDFFISDTLTGSLGGSAQILAIEIINGDRQYLLIGGDSLNQPNNIIQDSHGNIGTLVSFTNGNLSGPNPINGSEHGLENSVFLRGNRALILENIDGFAATEVQRASPSLMNLKFTAPYGLSGEFPDLESFSVGAIAQHFPRRTERVANSDFRMATTQELDALSAFQNSLVSDADPAFGQNFDFTFAKYATTELQKRGLNDFFGAGCGFCHSNTVLADEFLFHTGVPDLPINALDGLPTEQIIGAPANTRAFSTPTLFDLRSTAPFFHDNAIDNLRDAILFYTTPAFNNSTEGQIFSGILSPVLRSPGVVEAIEAFLIALEERPFSIDEQLSFIDTPAGLTTTLEFEISNTGTETLNLISHSITGRNRLDFAATLPTEIAGMILPGENKVISVTYRPSANLGANATFELDISIAKKRYQVGVALTGSAGAPNLVINTQELDFGDQGLIDFSLRRHTPLTIGIENSATAGSNLEIFSITLEGDSPNAFQFNSFPFRSIPVGDRFPINVSFDPKSIGEQTATLVIRSNDPVNPVIEISLRGNALDIALIDISISVFNNVLIEGDFLGVNATGTLSDGSSADLSSAITLHSSEPNVLQILRGFAIANRAGSTMLTASLNGVTSNAISITVESLPFIVSFNIKPVTVTLDIGDVTIFNAMGTFNNGTQRDVTFEVEWSSSDNNVLNIGFDGFAFAIGEGTAIVSAQTFSVPPIVANNTVIVTVITPAPLPPPLSPIVSFDISTINTSFPLDEGVIFVSAIATRADGSTSDISREVIWASSDVLVIEPLFDGIFFLLSEGSAVISAVTADGSMASNSLLISVTPPLAPLPPVSPPPLPPQLGILTLAN